MLNAEQLTATGMANFDGGGGPVRARPASAGRDMSTSRLHLQLGLDDLLGDLRHARRRGDLGRLALLAYCEVRRWARMAGDQGLAEHSSELITHGPHASREEFLAQVDDLIGELERVRLEQVQQKAQPPAG
jgi:hypothetical protein